MYIKIFRRKHTLSPCWEGPSGVLLSTYTAVKIKEKSSWIHACCTNQSRPRFSLSRRLGDSPNRWPENKYFHGQAPSPRSRPHHLGDSFFQEHRSGNFSFTYPSCFTGSVILRTKNKNNFLLNTLSQVKSLNRRLTGECWSSSTSRSLHHELFPTCLALTDPLFSPGGAPTEHPL